MINLILFGSFFVMLLLNIPIAVCLGVSSVFALLFRCSRLAVVKVPAAGYSVLCSVRQHHGQGGHLQPSGGVC